MGRARSLQFQLNANWEEVEGEPGILTYMRKGRTNHNAFQISHLSQTSDVRLEIDLEKFILEWVESIGGESAEVSLLEAGLGKMASATFSARDFASTDFAYCQAWFSTDGTDTIQATFICDGPPSPDELAEVSEMVRSMNLGDVAPSKKRRWWPF